MPARAGTTLRCRSTSGCWWAGTGLKLVRKLSRRRPFREFIQHLSDARCRIRRRSDDLRSPRTPKPGRISLAVAKRRMDGAKLYHHVKGGGPDAADGIAALAGSGRMQVQDLARAIHRLVRKAVLPANRAFAWVARSARVPVRRSAPLAQNEKVFVADEYYQGHLDWYNFDIDPSQATWANPIRRAKSRSAHHSRMLPTQVKFNGMPNTRWWASRTAGRTSATSSPTPPISPSCC